MSSTEKSKIDWRFGVVESGRREGWNDSAIAQFKENRLQALTREIIQNSMDARDKNKDGDKDKDRVVQVHFQERMIPREDIPNLDTLTDVLRKCSEDATDEPSDIKKEIEAVIKYARQDEIRVLSIKDTGTEGMPGPCENGKPFYRYLKASGQSGGEENRAGSHGIGKMAPLASSNMRAILVSTVWRDKDSRKLRELVQGRANLRSHIRSHMIGEKLHKKLHEGVGYWGRDFEPIEPKECRYRWLRREKKDKTGTTIHILGWSPTEKEWSDIILGYAAINFFAALERETLEVRIDRGEGVKDKILNKENIRKFFATPEIRDVMKKVGNLKEFEDSQFFHKCIADDEGVKIFKPVDLDYFGQSALRMRVEGGAPRKIAIIRNHMLITTYFKGFWKTIPSNYKDCGGVFECHEEGENELRGNKLLRSMEPPAHNQLSSDIPPAEAQENAKKSLEKLAEYLKEKVGECASFEVSSSSKIDFLKEYLGDEDGDTGASGKNTEFDPQGEFIIHSKPTKLSRLLRIGPPGKGQGGASKKKNKGKGGNRSGKEGPGDESDTIVEQPKQVNLLRRRVIRTGENAVRVVITSAETQEAYLLIDEVGEDIIEPLKMRKRGEAANMLQKLQISLKAKEPVALDLSLSRKIVGGLRLSVIARTEEKHNEI